MTMYTRSLMKTACIALTMTFATTTFYAASVTPAMAKPGNNGNGNGRSNRGERTERSSERTNNGRGHLARELRGLNAAHANPNALANASPNSMPGKLNVYKLSQEDFRDAVAVQDEAYAEYQRLIGLSEEEIEEQFPEGGYEDAVTIAAGDYEVARADAVDAQTTANESLSILTDGRELSEGALAELWRLLDM